MFAQFVCSNNTNFYNNLKSETQKVINLMIIQTDFYILLNKAFCCVILQLFMLTVYSINDDVLPEHILKKEQGLHCLPSHMHL